MQRPTPSKPQCYIDMPKGSDINITHYLFPILSVVAVSFTFIVCLATSPNPSNAQFPEIRVDDNWYDIDMSHWLYEGKFICSIGITGVAILLISTIYQRHSQLSFMSNKILAIIAIISIIFMCAAVHIDFKNQPGHRICKYIFLWGFYLYQMLNTLACGINLYYYCNQENKQWNMISFICGIITTINMALFYVLWMNTKLYKFQWLTAATILVYVLHFPILYAFVRKSDKKSRQLSNSESMMRANSRSKSKTSSSVAIQRDIEVEIAPRM